MGKKMTNKIGDDHYGMWGKFYVATRWLFYLACSLILSVWVILEYGYGLFLVVIPFVAFVAIKYSELNVRFLVAKRRNKLKDDELAISNNKEAYSNVDH